MTESWSCDLIISAGVILFSYAVLEIESDDITSLNPER